jgi:hypothetical protein
MGQDHTQVVNSVSTLSVRYKLSRVGFVLDGSPSRPEHGVKLLHIGRGRCNTRQGLVLRQPRRCVLPICGQ